MTRFTRCPVCEEPASDTPRCDCGYDFTHRDPAAAVVRLGYERRRARWLLRRGAITAVAAVGPLLLLAHQPVADQLEIATVILAQLVLGVWWAARGVLDGQIVRRRLRAAQTIGQLPAARVVHGGR